jgi:DNA-damage-inducible protein J
MPKTEYITARVEPQLKENAEAILRQLGMSTTGAITMFLQQVVLHEGLPFEVRVPSERGAPVGTAQRSGGNRDIRSQKIRRA